MRTAETSVVEPPGERGQRSDQVIADMAAPPAEVAKHAHAPSPPPAILLAFANDWVDDRRHLRNLLAESKAIGRALAPLVEAGALEMLPPIHNATVDDVIGAFRERRNRDRIRIFHFGGHASGSKLMLEDETGAQTGIHAGGLAGYLGRQRGLVLVFLNGCSTEPQVRRLRAAGVKAVVATTSSIDDAVAAEFARSFYAELAVRPLQDAFETAEQTVRLRWGDEPRAVTRDAVLLDEPGTPGWPWIIDCDLRYKTWKLESEVVPVHPWRRSVALAAIAIVLLLTTTLLLSAGARQTACRAPGLHSLCAAAGIGDLPTPAEQTLWTHALGQDSGEGLREYLREFPHGVHASEAQSRLAGCRHELVMRPGPEKVLEYPWLVPLSDAPLRTEDDARHDRVERGEEEAAKICEGVESKTFVVRSAQFEPEPRGWKCINDDHGSACRVNGKIFCRGQEQIETDLEHCKSRD